VPLIADGAFCTVLHISLEMPNFAAVQREKCSKKHLLQNTCQGYTVPLFTDSTLCAVQCLFTGCAEYFCSDPKRHQECKNFATSLRWRGPNFASSGSKI